MTDVAQHELVKLNHTLKTLFELAKLQPEVHAMLRSFLEDTDDPDTREHGEHLLSEIERILDNINVIHLGFTA